MNHPAHEARLLAFSPQADDGDARAPGRADFGPGVRSARPDVNNQVGEDGPVRVVLERAFAVLGRTPLIEGNGLGRGPLLVGRRVRILAVIVFHEGQNLVALFPQEGRQHLDGVLVLPTAGNVDFHLSPFKAQETNWASIPFG